MDRGENVLARHASDAWRVGLCTAEAARAWRRAPEEALLDDPAVQRTYGGGHDTNGRPLRENVLGLVRFLQRGRLGQLAIRQSADSTTLLVRDGSERVALLEEWGDGLTLYSRWGAVATIVPEHPYAPGEEDFASLVRLAQRTSARRPRGLRDGPDFVDPEAPLARIENQVQEVRPPDLIDRIVEWVRTRAG